MPDPEAGGGAPRRAPRDVHTVVIGAGSGGLTVAVGLARLGKRVTLVERDAVGGDCTNVGCIPSKTLIDLGKALAHLGDDARAARAAPLLREVRRRRDAIRAHEEAMLAGLPGLELLRGSARLEREPGRAPRVVVTAADGASRVVRARHVVLATGSSPMAVDVPGLPPERTLTNVTLFEIETPPRHLAIVGAGPIGCEMAFAFRHLGARVTLVERATRVLPGAEPEASAVLHRALERAGVLVHTETTAAAYEPAAGEPAAGEGPAGDLRLLTRGRPDAARGVDRVLLAVGRRPSSAGLGLEHVGVACSERGAILTDGAHRTSARGVFAIGDVTGRTLTTHGAHAQGRRLVRRIALPLPLVREGDYPSVTFGESEVAQIGPTRGALAGRFAPELLVTQHVALADTDRGATLSLTEGFVSITAMRLTGRVLAATIVGPGAGEMIHLLTLAQRRRMSLWRLSRLVVAYPALSEAIRIAADAFVFGSLPALPREAATYLRLRWRRRPRVPASPSEATPS